MNTEATGLHHPHPLYICLCQWIVVWPKVLEIFIGIVCVKNVYVQKDVPCKGTENLLMVNIISSVMNKEITSYLISYVGIVKNTSLGFKKTCFKQSEKRYKIIYIVSFRFPKRLEELAIFIHWGHTINDNSMD